MVRQGEVSPPGKSTEIASRLRNRIVRGKWAPGSRIPTRVKLEKEFNTTIATIQKALDLLAQDGWVSAQGARGTFVADVPPHTRRIGIVFPCDPTHPVQWRRMYVAIDEEARRLIHQERYDLRIYYGTAEDGSPGRRQLLEDIAADRLAGVFIFGMSLAHFADTPVLGHRYLRVAANSSDMVDGVLPVPFERFVPKAVRAARDAGRRKVALIYNPAAQGLQEELESELRRHGLSGHPNWCLPVWPDTAQAARKGAYLLLRQPEAERPDVILVSDDYLAEETTLGLRDAGVRVPEEVEVVVLCNFPHLPPAAAPITRLGYDLPGLLNRTVEALLASETPAKIYCPLQDESTWRSHLAEPNPSPSTPHEEALR
jgi:GntR family transcriptional regulator